VANFRYLGKVITNQNCTHKEMNGTLNPLNTELNPICHLLALLGAHHILHVTRIRVNSEKMRQNSNNLVQH
jgi:hypothetical protein